MDQRKFIILCAEANFEDIFVKKRPAFAGNRVKLPSGAPTQFEAGDAVVVSERSNALFAYVGIARGVVVDRASKSLTMQRYEAFAAPVVAYDKAHGIYRPELSDQHGFPVSFAYLTAVTHTMILTASVNSVEALLWQAVWTCACSRAGRKE